MSVTSEAIRAAVVGHANTGKTSLIRTLLRDTEFGEVADYAGTTRHVEVAQLTINQQCVMRIFDTPGLEDSVALRQLWRQHKRDQGSNAERMSAFIGQLDQHAEFGQEQKVLRQAFNSDVLLYVIDAREPYLGKYEDEIALLRFTSRPIVPVLNFIAAEDDNKKRWREKLIDHGLHAVVEYDTVAFTMQAERRLFEKLQTLDEQNYTIYQRIIDHNAVDFEERCRASAKAIAEQFINIAAYRVRVDNDRLKHHAERLQHLVRQAEQRTVDQLLDVFGFDKGDVRNDYLPVKDGKWELDLFDANTYKEFGVQISSGAAKGAAVGVGVDLVVGGVSLGVGAAIGAVAGVIWNTLKRYGGSLKNTFTGSSFMCVDDATVQLFLLRQRYLLSSLMARGHASQDVVTLRQSKAKSNATSNVLDKLVYTVRSHPQWSMLATQFVAFSEPQRQQCRESIVAYLLGRKTNE